MPIDASIYQNLRQNEMPSMLDSASKAATLSQMALQNQHMGQQMAAAERSQAAAERAQKASVFGEALESMSGMREQDRAAAFPKLRSDLMAKGILTGQEIPEQYDPQIYRSYLMRYRETAPAIENMLKKSQIAKNLADAAKERTMLGIKDITPGQKAADEAFGKESADYFYGGGKSAVEKNLQKIQGAIDNLSSNPGLTGRLSMKLPIVGSDAAQEALNPEMAAVRDDIRGAIQGTLRQTLGPQFTEKEGTAIFNRAFNPALSAAENARRATAELESLKRMAAQKDASMNQFLKSGSLRGYAPGKTEVPEQVRYASGGGGGLIQEANAAHPAPKPGAEDGGYVFMGGDPSNPKNWKRAR